MTLSGVAGKVPRGPAAAGGIAGTPPTIRLCSIPNKAGTGMLYTRVGTSLYQPLKQHVSFACFPSRPAFTKTRVVESVSIYLLEIYEIYLYRAGFSGRSASGIPAGSCRIFQRAMPGFPADGHNSFGSFGCGKFM